ncbi:MAG: MaoC family dehydratase N-terminal domain-containing protein [Streptosporangiaceae bacterium]
MSDWSPEPYELVDVLGQAPVRGLANLLDLDLLDLDLLDPPGGELPALWHWLFHLESVPQAELGSDGHPREGRFLPPMQDRRRMFAGARFRSHQPMFLGDRITRRSALASAVPKTGRSGALLFTTVRHEFYRDGALIAEEEQDLVYRSGEAAPRPHVEPEPALAPVGQGGGFVADPVMLFRFSALTGNAHRIHYDLDYATEVEGHRGLVVHGPLLALVLAEVPRREGRRVASLEFRAKAPVFAGQNVIIKAAGNGVTAVGPGAVTAMTLSYQEPS